MRSPFTRPNLQANATTLWQTPTRRSSVLPVRPVCTSVQPDGIHDRFVADLTAAYLAAKWAEMSSVRGPEPFFPNFTQCPSSTTLHARAVAQARQVEATLRGERRPLGMDTAAKDVAGESSVFHAPGSVWEGGWDPRGLAMIDTHSHIEEGERSGGGFVDSKYYIKRFLSMEFDPPISCHVVSGMHANNEIKAIHLEPWLDDLALKAHARDKTFIPWIRGFNLDDDFFSIRRYIRRRLDSGGFWGIGEVIVHGNKYDWRADSLTMKMICRLAIEYDVPVLLHVDLCGIGGYWVDNKWGDYKGRDPAEIVEERKNRFDELYSLFSTFRKEMTAPRDNSFFHSFPQPHPRLRIILDHAGIGRNDGEYDFDTYYEHMSALLEEFDYLYFTLAGVPNALLNPDLSALKPIYYEDWFIIYWNRFFVSVDVNNYDAMPDSYVNQYNMQVEIVEKYLGGLRRQRHLARQLLTSNVLGAPWAPL